MKHARFHTLLAPALAALLAAGAGCGGGTRACKQGTLFVTIVLDGTTSAADVIAVGVSIDGGMAKSDSHPRTAGGTTETIEINFPNGYPTGKRVDVQVTAYMGGSQIAMKTGTVASLADGCGTLTVTLEPGTGGTAGTGGGAGGRGGAAGSTSGAAGRGGAGGSTSGAAGRGGTTGAGGGLAGMGGAGGGLAGRGGSSGGTGGGLAGRGGTGGGSAGTGGTVGPSPCKFASFDTASEGFILNPFNTSPGNLLFREGGTIATMTFNGTEGSPTPGSLKVDAPYSDYNQSVDVTSTFSGARNLAGLKLHVRVKIASGLDQSVNSPPGVQPWASSYNVGARGLDYYWRGNWTVVTSGHAWADYVLDLKPENDFDPTQVVSFGVAIDAGNGLIGGSTVNPVKPTPAMIYVDSFWLEGTTCTGGAGGFGGGAGGAGGSLGAGCPASDPPSVALITDFSAVDGGIPLIPIGSTFSYGTPAGTPTPVATVQTGAWHVTLTAPGMAVAQYTGVGMAISGNSAGTDCINASSYSGISFKLSGSVSGSGCTVAVAISDSEHSDSAVDRKGSGPAGSYSPAAPVTPTQITAAPQTITTPFSAVTGGSPGTAINKARLTGIQWQFNVAAGTTNACNVDVNIDDVKFVP